MNVLTRVLLCLVLAGVSFAQTQPNIVGQSRGAAGTTWRVFAVAPNGQVMIVDLGAGLELDTSGAVPSLKVNFPPPVTPTPYIEVRKLFQPTSSGVTAAPQTFTLDHTLTAAQTVRLKVYRNGLLQYEVIDGAGDYTVSGNQITFSPVILGNGASVPAVMAGDKIQVIYYL